MSESVTVIPRIPGLFLSERDQNNYYLIKELVGVSKNILSMGLEDELSFDFISKIINKRLHRPLSLHNFYKIKEFIQSGGYYQYRLDDNAQNGIVKSLIDSIDNIEYAMQITRRTLFFKSMSNDIKQENLTNYDIHSTMKIVEGMSNLVQSLALVQQYTPYVYAIKMSLTEKIEARNNMNRNKNILGDGNNNNTTDEGHKPETTSGSQDNRGDNSNVNSTSEQHMDEGIFSNGHASNGNGHAKQQNEAGFFNISTDVGENGNGIHNGNGHNKETGDSNGKEKQSSEVSNSNGDLRSKSEDQNIGRGISKPTNRVF